MLEASKLKPEIKQGETMISTKNRIVSAVVAIAVLAMTSGLPQAVAAPKPTSISIIPTITSVAL